MNATRALVSIVVPCYNEEDVLGEFYDRVTSVAASLPEYAFEFLFVDDGSQDRTCQILQSLATEDDRVKVLSFSKNFGHQNAITAGLDHCVGDYVIVLDADLQDPPESIPAILERLAAGFDLVHMVRNDRTTDTFAKRFTARLFYVFMKRFAIADLPENSGDFKGFNRNVLTAISQYREQVRFLRGLFANLGFTQTEIPYKRDARYAGETKYPWRKVLRFATDAVLSFSFFPLRMCLLAGMASWGFLLAFLAWTAYAQVALGQPVNSLVTLLTVMVAGFSGMVLIGLGIVGEYLSRILIELKNRPLYHLRSATNLDTRTVPLPHSTSIRSPRN